MEAPAAHRATRPGATLLIICFSDTQPADEEWPWPTVSEQTLRDVLGSASWDIESLEPATCAANWKATRSKWRSGSSARSGAH